MGDRTCVSETGLHGTVVVIWVCGPESDGSLIFTVLFHVGRCGESFCFVKLLLCVVASC